MEKAASGVNQLLWFIHRTLYELIPSVLLDMFIYLILKSHLIKHEDTFPRWIVDFKDYVGARRGNLEYVVLFFSIVIVTHLLLEACSIVLGYTYIEKKHQENYESYPNYLQYKEKLNADLKEKFGDKYSFSPKDIVSTMRYKIMEEHKEFNTYLWYITTGTTTLGNLTVALMIMCILFAPVLSFDFCNVTDNLKWYYPILALINGATIWLFQAKLLNRKIKAINIWEAKNNAGAENRTFLAWDKFELAMLITAIAGYALCAMEISRQFFGSDLLKVFLFSTGITLLILPILYLIIVYKVIESKRFGKKMLDAYISIKYNNEIFSEQTCK